MKITQQQVRLALIFILGMVSFGLVVWAEITHNPIDATTSALLGIVVGFITAQTSNQQGAETANKSASANPGTLNLRVVTESQASPGETQLVSNPQDGGGQNVA